MWHWLSLLCLRNKHNIPFDYMSESHVAGISPGSKLTTSWLTPLTSGTSELLESGDWNALVYHGWCNDSRQRVISLILAAFTVDMSYEIRFVVSTSNVYNKYPSSCDMNEYRVWRIKLSAIFLRHEAIFYCWINTEVSQILSPWSTCSLKWELTYLIVVWLKKIDITGSSNTLIAVDYF